jgi:LL-diaminopimelate aminotransferase
MAKLNPYFTNLVSSYLFPQIEKKVNMLKSKFPKIELINLGIGDITKPLAKPIIKAMVDATYELEKDFSKAKYGPSIGFKFLRSLIAKEDYAKLNINEDEIFISNGAKCDISHIQELFDQKSIIAICDPTYPVYIDSNVMAGRSGSIKDDQYEKIVYLPCKESNNFYPELPKTKVDVIYLCSPNNPTGVALTYHELKKWVEYALENEAIIIFDGAYEAFITSDKPHSIYEIEGAQKCAIEIRSFSKKAGFTGLRCSYTVIPEALKIQGVTLRNYWTRRCETKFGGVPYPIQKAAAAIYSKDGKTSIIKLLDEYKSQMKTLTDGLDLLNLTYYGGKDAPYVWVKAQSTSWEFFDQLLNEAQIISIPGSGFGKLGEGYIRLSAFESEFNINKALNNLKKVFKCATR